MNCKTMTDPFLLGLYQDWQLSEYLFGRMERSKRLIDAMELEILERDLKPEPYGWVDPRVYETEVMK